ncbi:MAG: hypothetical protein M3Y74_07015 [Chloroflexota bacterium]|nr:hypothetical protein [Chloroflexota bacterium]
MGARSPTLAAGPLGATATLRRGGVPCDAAPAGAPPAAIIPTATTATAAPRISVRLYVLAFTRSLSPIMSVPT